VRICIVASSRFPVAEPFAGGLEAHTHLLTRRLTARGHEVTLFAAPGSDPALGARELPVRAFASSAAARLDVGATPEEWLREHHAYLGLMLDLAGRGTEFDVVQNSSLHHLPLAMTPLLAVPVVTTLHTPPVGWLESAIAFASPRARFGSHGRRAVAKVLVLGIAGLALWDAGHHAGALLFVVFSALVNGLALLPAVSAVARRF